MSEKAQSRALAISEIVTSILHHMDTRTLLAAQRISRTWNDLIRNTQSLQEALFLRPISNGRDLSTRVDNPLLAEAFPSLFRSKNGGNNAKGQSICLTDLAWQNDPATRVMFVRPEASWRRMLTHQPPLYRVGVFYSSCTAFFWEWSQAKADIPDDGLRMAPLFEYLIDRNPDDWAYGMSIEMFFPSSSSTGLLASEKPKNWREDRGAGWTWKELMGQFDLVLQVIMSTDCMAEMDYQEEKEEREKEAKEKGMELPDTDVDVSERIRECYRELGVRMEGFQMEEYNKGSGAW